MLYLDKEKTCKLIKSVSMFLKGTYGSHHALIHIYNSIHSMIKICKMNCVMFCKVIKGNDQNQLHITNTHVPRVRELLHRIWRDVKTDPLLNQLFPKPPRIALKKNKSLRDMLVRAKLKKHNLPKCMQIHAASGCLQTLQYTFRLPQQAAQTQYTYT